MYLFACEPASASFLKIDGAKVIAVTNDAATRRKDEVSTFSRTQDLGDRSDIAMTDKLRFAVSFFHVQFP